MKKLQRRKILLYVFLIVGITCAVYRIFPYFSSMMPLWYDPWVYRWIYLAYVKLAPVFQFSHVPYRIMHEPLRGIFSVVISKLWISIDILLTFWLWFFSILWWFLVFLIIKKYSTQAAIFAMILFWISIIQYHAFELCYYKQVIGVDLMLILIYFRNGRKYRTSLPFLVALILLHRTTTVYLWMTGLLYIILQYITTKKLNKKFVLIWILWLVIWLPLYGTLFQRLLLDFFHPLVTTVWGTGIQGNFFSRSEFRWFVMLLIVPTWYGVYMKIKNKEYDVMFSWLIVWIIWVSLWLLNANRMELFLDVYIILITGYALHYIFKSNKKRLIGLVYIWMILQMIYYYGYVSQNNMTWISPGEFQSIITLKDIVPTSGIVIWTDSFISPWIAGYADRDWITPWLSDINQMTHKEWDSRRPASGEQKCKMFERYMSLDRPLYMRESKLFREENVAWWKCFNLIRTDEYHNLYKIIF
jgi:hypothetical protein